VIFFVVMIMYVILLNKLKFDQINYSGRSGMRWQYGVPKWYEIVKMLGTAGVEGGHLTLTIFHFKEFV